MARTPPDFPGENRGPSRAARAAADGVGRTRGQHPSCRRLGDAGDDPGRYTQCAPSCARTPPAVTVATRRPPGRPGTRPGARTCGRPPRAASCGLCRTHHTHNGYCTWRSAGPNRRRTVRRRLDEVGAELGGAPDGTRGPYLLPSGVRVSRGALTPGALRSPPPPPRPRPGAPHARRRRGRGPAGPRARRAPRSRRPAPTARRRRRRRRRLAGSGRPPPPARGGGRDSAINGGSVHQR
jgi:hypothetical protein